MFPEGATTNSQALLAPLPIFDKVSVTATNMHVVAVKYPPAPISPCFVIPGIANFLVHILKLSSQPANLVELREVCDEDVASIAQTVAGSDSLAAELMSALARAMRLPRAELTAKDKQEFLDFAAKEQWKGL